MRVPWLLLMLYSIVWSAAFVLSVALFVMSSFLLSRVLFVCAALFAYRRLVGDPFA